jgi:predicted negative regulator of RcsB-dependent stress response
VEIYDSEREQLDAIKRWWKENGQAVVIGVVLGLGGILGWRSWQSYQENQAARASAEYEQLVASLNAGARERATQEAKQILAEYADTTYGSLTSLLLARVYAEQQKWAEAAGELRRVMDNGKPQPLRQVARLRLARVLTQQGQLEDALSVLAPSPDAAFAAAYHETRGDVLLAKGDLDGARGAYGKALEGPSSTVADREVLRVKLADLGGAPAP